MRDLSILTFLVSLIIERSTHAVDRPFGDELQSADSTPLDEDVEPLRSSEWRVCDESRDVTESLSLLWGLE